MRKPVKNCDYRVRERVLAAVKDAPFPKWRVLEIGEYDDAGVYMPETFETVGLDGYPRMTWTGGFFPWKESKLS